MDEGIGTEIVGESFQNVGHKLLRFANSETLHSCLGWDGNFNSQGREKPLSCCIVTMSKERRLRHVCHFFRAEASYKQPYYLYASMAAWKSRRRRSQTCLNPPCLAVIPLGSVTISASSLFISNSRRCSWQGSGRVPHGLAAATCPSKGTWSCCRGLMGFPGDPPRGSEGLGGECSPASCKNPPSNLHRTVSTV